MTGSSRESESGHSRCKRSALHADKGTVSPGISRLAATALASIAVLAACGCGSTSDSARSGSEVDVSVKDFHIKAPRRVPAGEVTFDMYNKGPDHHELIVIRDDG